MGENFENLNESNNYEEFEITLVNTATNVTCPGVMVCGLNTLEQLKAEYAEELGMNQESRILYTNKRTSKSTSDGGVTMDGFGVMEGDVISFNNDAVVG